MPIDVSPSSLGIAVVLFPGWRPPTGRRHRGSRSSRLPHPLDVGADARLERRPLLAGTGPQAEPLTQRLPGPVVARPRQPDALIEQPGGSAPAELGRFAQPVAGGRLPVHPAPAVDAVPVDAGVQLAPGLLGRQTCLPGDGQQPVIERNPVSSPQ